MMSFHLAIDIGNSRSKLGLFKREKLIHTVVINNQELDNANKIIDGYDISAAIVSSVNGPAEKRLKLVNYTSNVFRLSHITPLPIELAYESPDTLGKDRIASVVGAEMQFPKRNVLVIDAGSCITYDFLTAQKVYLGGAISPGIQMRLKAMNQFTDQLPLIDWSVGIRPETIGKTTITSMLSGVVNGIIKEINGFINDYNEQYPKLQIVITGGDANFFEKELKNGIFADPNLVLKGLNEILIYNCE